jgi:hypothetical protein
MTIRSWRCDPFPGSWRTVLLLAMVVAFCPRGVRATLPPGVEGCSYVSGSHADIRQDGSELPYCNDRGGSGCYECCVTERDQSGWRFCTEMSGLPNCSGPQDWFPAWWPDPDNGNPGEPRVSLPPDTTPPQDWTSDDGSGNDLGGGGGDPPPDYLYSAPPAHLAQYAATARPAYNPLH